MGLSLTKTWTFSLTLGVACLALQSPVFAQTKTKKKDKEGASLDWIQWRGPNLNGNTTEVAWLKKWPKVRLKVRWERDVGRGYTAAALTKDKVYTAGYKNGKDIIYCLDAKKGKPVWGYTYASAIYDNMNAGGPSASPCLADGRLFMISREAKLFCLDAKKGKLKWGKELTNTVGAKIPDWGFSGSPIVVGKQLFVDVGPILCYNVKSGQRIWKTQNYGAGYSTPVPFERDGKKLLAVFPAKGLIILNRSDGKEVASYNWTTSYSVNAATPLLHNDEIFISSGYNTGCAMVTFNGKSLTEKWKNKNMRNHMASCVRWKDYLYGFDESQLKCLDTKTGKEMWAQRGLGKGCLIMAEGKLVVLSDRGELLIAPASEKKFEAVTRKKILNASGCWSAPVLAHNRIICRSPRGALVCVDVKAK